MSFGYNLLIPFSCAFSLVKWFFICIIITLKIFTTKDCEAIKETEGDKYSIWLLES